MKTRNQSGSAHLVTIVILVVALLGVLGFVFWQNFSKSPEASTQKDETTSTKFSKSYTSELGFFSIQYPDDWTLDIDDKVLDDNGEVVAEPASLVSPTGTILGINADNGIGRGGICAPEDSDIPFAAGNSCSSWQYLSVEKLPIGSVYYLTGKTSYDYEEADVLLVSVHYGSKDGAQKYLLGLEAAQPAGAAYPRVDDPQMGLIYPDLQMANYSKTNDGIFADKYTHIGIYASSDEESFLNSPDAETIRAIVKTFKVADQ